MARKHLSRRALALGAVVLTSTTLTSLTAMAGTVPTPAQLERGRYLIKTTGCNDCHTQGYTESAGRVAESRWLTGSSLGWQGP